MWFWRTWLPIAVVVTGLCGLVYVSVQQMYRQSLNDPQVQMAEDGAALLRETKAPAALVDRNSGKVDIAADLAPWIAAFDTEGTTLESSAVLDNAPVHPPLSALQAAQYGGKGTDRANESRITWQPRDGVRQALVIVWVPEMKEYVVSGRNMREVEYRVGELSSLSLAGWLVMLAATLAVSFLARRKVS